MGVPLRVQHKTRLRIRAFASVQLDAAISAFVANPLPASKHAGFVAISTSILITVWTASNRNHADSPVTIARFGRTEIHSRSGLRLVERMSSLDLDVTRNSAVLIKSRKHFFASRNFAKNGVFRGITTLRMVV